MYLIFEKLDLDTLLKVASLKFKYSSLVSPVYRKKFSHLTFVFGNNNELTHRAIGAAPMEFSNVTDKTLDDAAIDRLNRQLSQYIVYRSKVTETEIVPGNYGFLLYVYKYFGHFIKKIKVRCWAYAVHLELIARLISAYNARSLVDIEFDFGADRILEQLTTPLFNVESVTFRGYRRDLNYQAKEMSLNVRNINLNEMFPSLRRLHLESMNETDYDIFDYNIPNLQHVSLIKTYEDRFEHRHIRLPEVILKNPQIKSIELKYANDPFVRNINSRLPQLETLTLSYLMVDLAFHLEFANVTSFRAIRTTDQTRTLPYHAYGLGNLPHNLHFPKLQRLYIDYAPQRSEQWITFLENHNNVKELHLKGLIEYQEFQDLTANLALLEKVSLEYEFCHPQMQILESDSIVHFLTARHNMKQFNVINCPKQCIELQSKLQPQYWNAITIDGGMSFQRRKNIQL